MRKNLKSRSAWWASRLIGLLLLLLLIVVVVLRLRYGGGPNLPVHNYGEPTVTAMQKVADLRYPPGNVAVSNDGRVFLTLHPEGRPDIKVAEWVGGEARPFPDSSWQGNDERRVHFQSPLALRLDVPRNRLWVLDNANHGFGQVRLLAFDINSRKLLHQFDFPAELAPRGSHLNDFQISSDGRTLYIADASILGLKPALLVFDLKTNTARRLLERHVSVMAERYVPVVQGRRMQVLGCFAIRPGVDSIALSRDGEWLYFAAVTAQHLYRVPTESLLDPALSAAELSEKVTIFAAKPGTDGLSSDNAGNVYLSSPEASSILKMQPTGEITTLLQSELIRWPDGFSFGPDGWLYFTTSALHQVIGKSASQIEEAGPYQVWRFRTGEAATAGQ